MKAKILSLIVLILLLSACKQQTGKPIIETTEKDTAAIVPASDSIPKGTASGTVSTYQAELDKALADPSIDKYYKDVYRQEKLIWTDENKMLSITENLFTKDTDKDLFYFLVFTKSMNGSDGFYSESLGLAAYKFITTKTSFFADYFNVAPKLTQKDLDKWAYVVWGEIQISEEGNEAKAVKQLENQLYKNTELDRKEYHVIIERLIKAIKSYQLKSKENN